MVLNAHIRHKHPLLFGTALLILQLNFLCMPLYYTTDYDPTIHLPWNDKQINFSIPCALTSIPLLFVKQELYEIIIIKK